MAIVTNGRLEYEMSAIDVTYPDVGKVTYRGSYPLIVPNQWAPPKEKCDNCLTFTGKDSEFTLKATNKTWGRNTGVKYRSNQADSACWDGSNAKC